MYSVYVRVCFVKFKPRESFNARRPPKINILFHKTQQSSLTADGTALTPLPRNWTNDDTKALNYEKRSARYAIFPDAANCVTDLPGRGLTFLLVEFVRAMQSSVRIRKEGFCRTN